MIIQNINRQKLLDLGGYFVVVSGIVISNNFQPPPILARRRTVHPRTVLLRAQVLQAVPLTSIVSALCAAITAVE